MTQGLIEHYHHQLRDKKSNRPNPSPRTVVTTLTDPGDRHYLQDTNRESVCSGGGDFQL